MSGLSSEQKDAILDLSKTVSKLHKKSWIDDEKKEHYRNLLRKMLGEKTFDAKTFDRLEKRLDKIKKKNQSQTQSQNEKSLSHSQTKQSTTRSTHVTKPSKTLVGSAADRKTFGIKRKIKGKEEPEIKSQSVPAISIGNSKALHHEDSGDVSAQEKVDPVDHRAESDITTRPQHLPRGPFPYHKPYHKPHQQTHHLPSAQYKNNQEPIRSLKHDKSDGIPASSIVEEKKDDITKAKVSKIFREREPQNNNYHEQISSPRHYKPARMSTISIVEEKKDDMTKAKESKIFRERESQQKCNSIYHPKDVKSILSPTDLKNTFVETCLFGNMKFVQPPSCLRCALAKEKGDSSGSCNNLVIWRKNANDDHKLHPDKLDGNIVFVTCSAAQCWMRNEIVGGMKWNAKEKKLIIV